MKKLSIIACTLLLSLPFALAAEVVAIVHKDCADASVSAKAFKSIYLGKQRSWSDGTKVILYTQTKGTGHGTFMKTNVKKSASQFKAYWKKQVFTGKGRMPDDFADDAAMIKAVSENAGAVGYVDKASAEGKEGIKILEIK